MNIYQVRQNPIIAMRSVFHHPDGRLNTKAAAQYFKVTERTIYRWEETGLLPEWALSMLSIVVRGFLPDNRHWADFTLRGDSLYFHGHRGFRRLSAGMMKCFELALPDHDIGDAKARAFWDRFTMLDNIKH